MTKAMLIRVSIIVYIIEPILTKYFTFANSDANVFDRRKMISYIGI